jgi:hypothetical protein
MKFSEESIPYLKGNKFTNSLRVPIADSGEPIQSRLEFVVKLCEGKQIIHLGCADHKEIIDDKIKKNQWLHKLLTEHAAKCIGVDNNIEALEHIKKIGYTNVYAADITHDALLPEIIAQKWDYMILGEIIEHISDPAAFLNALRMKYAGYVGKIILTTPHAFRYKNFTRAAFNHQEIINSDHRFWFTPFTLAKIAVDAGLSPEEFWLVENLKPGPRSIFKKWLLKKYPAYRDTIIMSCALNP